MLTMKETAADEAPLTPESQAMQVVKQEQHGTASEPKTRRCQPLGSGVPRFDPAGRSLVPSHFRQLRTASARAFVEGAGSPFAAPVVVLCVAAHFLYDSPVLVATQRFCQRRRRSA